MSLRLAAAHHSRTHSLHLTLHTTCGGPSQRPTERFTTGHLKASEARIVAKWA